RPEQPDVVMIAWATWQTRYGGRPDILDRFVELGPPVKRYQIVGVLGREVVLPQIVNQAPAFLLPGESDARQATNPNRLAFPIARLKPEPSVEAATAALQSVIAATEREHLDFPQGRRARLVPL